uniref:MADF domain-containing protein n=1 Tax=Ciona intestinalis TaxID=7719 RepID=H2XZA2_CIOIN
MNPVNFELIDEVLIEEVRKPVNLYNAKLKSYRDRNEAEKSWFIISQTTNISVAECKQSWKRLRNKYVR